MEAFSGHFAGFQFSCAARSAAREARRPLCMGEKPAAGGGLKSRCFGFFGAPKSDLGGRRRIFWKYLEIHSCYSTFFTIFSYTSTPRFKAGPPQGGLRQKNGPAAVRPRISCLDCLNSCLYWCSQKPRFPGSFLAPFLRKIRDCGGVFSTFCAFLTVSPRQMIVFRPFSRHFAGFQFSCAARSAAREARRPLCRGKKPAAGGGLKSRCFGVFGAPKSDLGGPARNLLELFKIPFLLLYFLLQILVVLSDFPVKNHRESGKSRKSQMYTYII